MIDLHSVARYLFLCPPISPVAVHRQQVLLRVAK